MCGIAGAVNFKLDNDVIDAKMHHRGPDEQAAYSFRNTSFYHLRLSILDIAGGKQPMHLHDKYTIVFNGEIYNHREIRQKLNIQGQTSSDTETLLLLYERFGTDFLDNLDGMFVFAIHDKVKNIVFIARDRAGKKPLYYFNDGKSLIFASELNCLKGLLPLEIEERNLFHYLHLGSLYRNMTPYKHVSELPGGSYMTVDCDTLKSEITRWWDIHDFYSKSCEDSFEESRDKVDEFLHSAVKRRIESSDLEVGCFLSGGIDSGLVTAIASKYNQQLKTFTISFEGEYNEAPLAKLVAKQYGTDHTEINISLDHLTRDVERIIANYGEPFFDSSAIPSFYVSQEARRYLTVILNGDGADELFGGYRRYVPFAKYDFFKKNCLVRGGAKFIRNILPQSHNKKSKYNYLYRLASLASKSHLEIYLSAGVDIFEDYEKHILSYGYDYLEAIRADFDKIANSNLSGLKKIMNLDFDTNLFGDLLVKMDIATMAHSLEGRSPFLSKDLLEYVPSINDSYKIKAGTTKYLLRQLAVKYLPSELINQPKRGFEIPLKSWVNNNLKDMIYDYVTAKDALNRKFVDVNFTSMLLHQKIRIPEEKRAKILWSLFCMEVWYKKICTA
jgi:asparagine synthase (glutamine-hydrolysing)